MSLIRIYGTNDEIVTIRNSLQQQAVEVSRSYSASNVSKQLSNLWTSPEAMETLKFVTLFLQSSAAGISILATIRNVLKDQSSVVLEHKDDAHQMKLEKTTSNNDLSGFVEAQDKRTTIVFRLAVGDSESGVMSVNVSALARHRFWNNSSRLIRGLYGRNTSRLPAPNVENGRLWRACIQYCLLFQFAS